jgi:hypothetical protein
MHRSLTVTLFLTLAAGLLWVGVVRMLLLLASQLAVAEVLNMRVPATAEHLAPLCRWLSLYWWIVLLGIGLLTPIVGLITWWVRHRVRTRLWSWVWGVLLVVPPVLILEAVLPTSFVINQAMARGLRAERDRYQECLSPDGGQLRWPLTIREVRRGQATPTGEVLVIQPAGEWRVTRLLTEEGQPPLRQGKLREDQLLALARQLATLNMIEVPSVRPFPVLNHDSLQIEFGPSVEELVGVCRANWWNQDVPAEPGEEEMRSRFRTVILFVDDLVKDGNRP